MKGLVTFRMILFVVGGALGLRGAASGMVNPKQGEKTPRELAKDFIDGTPVVREELLPRLRRSGEKGGLALLDLCEKKPKLLLDPKIATFLFRGVPVRATKRVLALRDHLDPGGRMALLEWLSRRDLPSFRDFENLRAQGLLDFVGWSKPETDRALRELAKWDLPLVVRGLFLHLTNKGPRSPGHSPLDRRQKVLLCHSLRSLRAAGTIASDVLAWMDGPGRSFAPALLPLFSEVPDFVLKGQLDPWLFLQTPEVQNAVQILLRGTDNKLFAQLRHRDRLNLFERFRKSPFGSNEEALKVLHIACMDLGKPDLATEALEWLLVRRRTPQDDAELWSLSGIAAFLTGAPSSLPMEKATKAVGEMVGGDLGEAGPMVWERAQVEFEWTRAWRTLVPPKVPDREYEARLRWVLRVGGRRDEIRREALRKTISVQCLGGILAFLEGDRVEAEARMDRAVEAFEECLGLWDEDLLGANQDLDQALSLRSGPLHFLIRALEGNEGQGEYVSSSQRNQRIAASKKGFRFLVKSLARRLPDRVLSLPGQKISGGVGTDGSFGQEQGERAVSSINFLFEASLQRLGEQKEALAVLAHWAKLLKNAGLPENLRLRAQFVFEKASIAIDQRRPKIALAALKEYLRFMEDRLREARQHPELFVSPKTVERYYAGRVAAGLVNMAVLYNVVLGKPGKALEYCRRAYMLEDSPFNRILYACYLARDGKCQEAKDLLNRVDIEPNLYYNLACTHALCGEKEKALHWLQLDLEKNYPTEKARNRQRLWAKKDKDLSSLRGDSRFEALVKTIEGNR
jgi:tetratricopeptide (TPR) repeat protein